MTATHVLLRAAYRTTAAWLVLAVQLSCATPMTTHPTAAASGVTKSSFGRLDDGTPVDLYTIRNRAGIEARVITYGGIIVSLDTPDRNRAFDDIVLGFDSLASYVHDSPYFGAIVGRYANRIAKGRFTLDGRTYQLPINNPPNSLHGGDRGFDKVVWNAAPFDRADGAGVVLTHVSPDGDQGYPGTVRVQVTYTLTDKNELSVAYHATADRATPINLSQHTYFNLTGNARDVLGHVLTLNAERYTPVDSTLIPTGELASVAATPFDFRSPTPIGARIGAADEQLRRGHGYDHNFVLTQAASGLTHAAHVLEPTTGRTLDVYTDQPGVQFYTGNFLDGTITGKGGKVYGHRAALCLETQHFPDSPNHPKFPSAELKPGQKYHEVTIFRFSTR